LGDCTAAHHSHQADPRVENIYWTLFAWILDRNYQILEVHFDGQLVLKAHLLPLFYQGPQGLTPFLALDAIETGTALRDDVDGPVDARLSEQ
ncbi:MAG: hypothetical protein GWN58_57965, partial [Anaerolineae bacterium]|nr:hypothetical protein [Anaerolineae bacterium]